MRKEKTKFTVVEAARVLGVILVSTYRAIWERRLVATKDTEGAWVISSESLEAFKAHRKARLSRRPRTASQRDTRVVPAASAQTAEATL